MNINSLRALTWGTVAAAVLSALLLALTDSATFDFLRDPLPDAMTGVAAPSAGPAPDALRSSGGGSHGPNTDRRTPPR